MPDKKNPASIDDPNRRNVTPEPDKKTGAGAEATEGMDGKAKGSSHQHRSAYGGEGGEPKNPNDFPKSRR